MRLVPGMGGCVSSENMMSSHVLCLIFPLVLYMRACTCCSSCSSSAGLHASALSSSVTAGLCALRSAAAAKVCEERNRNQRGTTGASLSSSQASWESGHVMSNYDFPNQTKWLLLVSASISLHPPSPPASCSLAGRSGSEHENI